MFLIMIDWQPDCVDLNDGTTSSAAKGVVKSEPTSPDKKDVQNRSAEGTISHPDSKVTTKTQSVLTYSLIYELRRM